MNIYGMGQGLSLGQGTFTFDKIVPNRCLLDKLANQDKVLPGRYALVEYNLPLAIVSDINNLSYTKNKLYDIFPKIDISDEDEEISFSFDSTINYIYVCTDEGSGNYKYYYASIPDESSSSSTEPENTNEGSHLSFNQLGNSTFTPYDFNRLIDLAYANSDPDDNISSERFALWDSTAWLKIVEHNLHGSDFKYINVADLNVITPTFKVLGNTEDDIEEIPFITTFDWSDKGNATTADTANFNVPKVKEGKDGVFSIRYPNPMNIEIAGIDVTNTNNSATATSVYTANGKNFTLKFPEIARAITSANAATTAAKAATTAAKAATTAALIATTAALAATTAAEVVTTNTKGLIKLIYNNKEWPDEGSLPSINSTNYGSILSNTNNGALWQAVKTAYESGLSIAVSNFGTNGIIAHIGSPNTTNNGTTLDIRVSINSENLLTSLDIIDLWVLADGYVTNN